MGNRGTLAYTGTKPTWGPCNWSDLNGLPAKTPPAHSLVGMLPGAHIYMYESPEAVRRRAVPHIAVKIVFVKALGRARRPWCSFRTIRSSTTPSVKACSGRARAIATALTASRRTFARVTTLCATIKFLRRSCRRRCCHRCHRRTRHHARHASSQL